jgi:hypothetical protein
MQLTQGISYDDCILGYVHRVEHLAESAGDKRAPFARRGGEERPDGIDHARGGITYPGAGRGPCAGAASEWRRSGPRLQAA